MYVESSSYRCIDFNRRFRPGTGNCCEKLTSYSRFAGTGWSDYALYICSSLPSPDHFLKRTLDFEIQIAPVICREFRLFLMFLNPIQDRGSLALQRHHKPLLGQYKCREQIIIDFMITKIVKGKLTHNAVRRNFRMCYVEMSMNLPSVENTERFLFWTTLVTRPRHHYQQYYRTDS